MTTPEDILAFWLDEVGPQGWYEQSDALDDTIRTRFAGTLDGLMAGRYGLWLTYPSGALAYIVVADQFSRNLFRGDARSFASDEVARAAAKQAIHRGWDLKIDSPARQFFYLPLMHSENLIDQDRCVRLIKERMPEAASSLLHARVHREIIRDFGRFPFRNQALSRRTTPVEQEFIDNGGYGATLRAFQAKLAA